MYTSQSSGFRNILKECSSGLYNKRSGAPTVFGLVTLTVIAIVLVNVWYRSGSSSGRGDASPKFGQFHDKPELPLPQPPDVKVGQLNEPAVNLDVGEPGQDKEPEEKLDDGDDDDADSKEEEEDHVENKQIDANDAEEDKDFFNARIQLEALKEGKKHVRKHEESHGGVKIHEFHKDMVLDESFQFPDFDPEKEQKLSGFMNAGGREKKHSKYHKPEPKKFPVRVMQTPWKVLKECPDDLLTLVLLHSDPSKPGRRRVIRETWGTQSKEKYPNLEQNEWQTIFVMGRQFESTVDIAAENQKHGDILQGDFEDTPYEDTRKFLLALRWVGQIMATKGCKPKFILKSKDNIYHNMFAITKWLEFRLGGVTDDLYLGNVLRKDRPIRDPTDPLYVSRNDYRYDYFPDLVRGPVYLFSLKTYLGFGTAISKQVPLAMEDGYIGVLANINRILPTMNDHFQMLAKMSNVCHYLSAFFVHDVTAAQQLEIWLIVKGKHHELCEDSYLVKRERQRKLET